MDTEEGFERLKKALLRIDGELAGEPEKQETGTGYDGAVHNEIVISLREAYDGEKELRPPLQTVRDLRLLWFPGWQNLIPLPWRLPVFSLYF